MERRTFLGAASATITAPFVAGCTGSATRSITLDWAYYNPVSLVLREHGWLEAEFADDDVEIEWVLSLGSNEANEYSQSEAAEFASTAGIAALMARTNDVPIRTPYVYSTPEWTALVAKADAGIEDVAHLEGKDVAATRGTDPHFFLLKALEDAGLSEEDVEIVDLQHSEGQSALVQDDVDAWAGLDPHMAELELEADVELFYRRPEYNTYGFLNVLEEFLADHPDDVERVLETYERGREWAIDNPDATAEILADESELSQEVAERVFVDRTDLSTPAPGEEHRELLSDLAPILEREGLVGEGADLRTSIDELIDTETAASVIE